MNKKGFVELREFLLNMVNSRKFDSDEIDEILRLVNKFDCD